MLDRAFRAGASGPCAFWRYADFFYIRRKIPRRKSPTSGN
jgi:hypothetical protein